jgi:outer membrane protein assembly factor BamE (lipoprotein component of BamABCDE complex)
MKSIYRRLPSALRAVLPWFIICVCFVVLTGCIWIPTFEHGVDNSQKDFRGMVGDEKSKRPIRPNGIQQQQVLSLLGLPFYASKDGKTIYYIFNTEDGLWIAPECFAVAPVESNVHMLRLNFDDAGTLVKWDAKYKSASAPDNFWAQPYQIVDEFKDDKQNSNDIKRGL